MFPALEKCSFFGKQITVGIADDVYLLTAETKAFQAHHIQSAKMSPVSHSCCKGNHIIFNTTHAADKGMFSDADKLMDCRQSTQNDVITDNAMTANGGVVGEDHMRANLAIMGNMCPGHASPILVTMPPPSVPGFMVTFSRITLFLPTINELFSP